MSPPAPPTTGCGATPPREHTVQNPRPRSHESPSWVGGSAPPSSQRHMPPRGPATTRLAEKSKRKTHTSNGTGLVGIQLPFACRLVNTPGVPAGPRSTLDVRDATSWGHQGAPGIEPYQPGTIMETLARCAMHWERSGRIRPKTALRYTMRPDTDWEKTLTLSEAGDVQRVKWRKVTPMDKERCASAPANTESTSRGGGV
jgi:hypothetical protein